MKHLRKRIFYKILIPTLFVYILISSLVFIKYQNTYRESIVKTKEIEMLNISRVLGDWISTRITELMVLSNSEDLWDENKKHQFLRHQLSQNNHIFNNLWIVERDYTYRNTNYKTGNIFNKDEFEKLFNEELIFSYISPDEFWKYSNDRLLVFSVPIYKDDRVISILSGSFPLSELERVIKLYTYNIFDEFALIDVYDSIHEQIGGTVILHSSSAMNGTHEMDLYDKIYSTNSYGEKQNYFVADLINSWKLICLIRSSDLYSQLYIFKQFFIIITFGILILISMLTISISGSISKPILILNRMVHKMIKGDFKNEIMLDTQDELQDLADAFNLLNKRTLQLRTDDRFIFLGRISSRMAHEIRHPLHIIQIAAQTITPQNFDNNKLIISKEIKKADMFIREILEIAKPNQLSIQRYSMDKLIKNILNSLALLKDEKNIDIQYNNNSNNEECNFDVLKMEQVITNIINNSRDAIPENGEIIIEITNGITGNLILTIKDTGPGFNENIVNKLFDPFFTTKENGTGLGLSICYQIISAHGALIELSNRESGGAETKIIFSNKVKDPA